MLVAPGRALTCAHVVHSHDIVRLEAATPIRAGGIGTESADAEVICRSAPPEIEGRLWPFPDLAVLAWENDGVAHPVAPLHPAFPQRRPVDGDRVGAWGYGRREDGMEPPGQGVGFDCEGYVEDDLWPLTAGQAPPGLSGAPIVSPTTRTVIGLVSASRDVETDLGAYATPTTALEVTDRFRSTRPDTDRPSDDLTRLITANQAASLADRTPWLAVFEPPPSARFAARPWAEFRRTERSTPSELLRADLRVVPYLFRDENLSWVVNTWCQSPEPARVLSLSGSGGAGKTRFAIELSREMNERGWLTAWFDPRGHPPEDLQVNPAPRLLVIDYLEEVTPAVLRPIIDRAAASGDPLAPVRLILLTRTHVSGADSIETLKGTHEPSGPALQLLNTATTSPASTELLDHEQRQLLWHQAVESMAQAWNVPVPQSDRPDLSADSYGRPLDVLLEALDSVIGPSAPTVEDEVAEPLARVFAHEQRYWAAQNPDVDPSLIRWVAATATLVGPAAPTDVEAIMALHPGLAGPENRAIRAALLTWWSGRHDAEGVLPPLTPDRLGEHLVVEALAERAAASGTSITGLLSRLLDSCADRQAAVLLETLARAREHRAWLADAVRDLIARRILTLDVARADLDGEAKAVAALRLIDAPVVAALRKGPARTTDRETADTASKLLALGHLARRWGMTTSAHLVIYLARDLFTTLNHHHPNNPDYQHGLAVAHAEVADLDAAAGDTTNARTGYTTSRDILTTLNHHHPNNPDYQYSLAVAHSRMAETDPDPKRLLAVADMLLRQLVA
ncbi:MAG: serine protease, partial [Acidimicrobiales bacterium]